MRENAGIVHKQELCISRLKIDYFTDLRVLHCSARSFVFELDVAFVILNPSSRRQTTKNVGNTVYHSACLERAKKKLRQCI